MNKNHNEFSNLGEQIKNIVTDAVGSMDYGQLNKNISNTVNVALDEVRKGIERGTKEAASAFSQATANPHFEEQFTGGVGQKNILKKWFSKKESLFPVDKNAIKPALGVTFVAVGATFASISAITASVLGLVFRSVSVVGPVVVIGLAFVGMFAVGRRFQKRKKRFENYLMHIGERKYIEITELAQRSHQSVKFTRTDLQKLITLGVFPDGHISTDKQYFMGDYETYKLYLNAKENAKNQKIENTKKEERLNDTVPKEVLDAARQGKEFMAEIRQVNELIPGEEISQKLDTLELVTAKIFQRVQEKPTLLSDIRKFMDYYLPTTKKLVNAYKEFDLQPIQGENIKKSKADIEETLDTINTAFLNLYNSLFEGDVMDVNADISVLHAMFAREGLTNKDFVMKENK